MAAALVTVSRGRGRPGTHAGLFPVGIVAFAAVRHAGQNLRLADIQAAIDAIRSHLQRGDLSDGLIFDAAHMEAPAPPAGEE